MSITHSPALTAEQWKRTSIKKRLHRLKDLRKYIEWCKEQFGSECNQIRFALRQVKNIRESIAPENNATLLVKMSSSFMGAKRMSDYATVGKFSNVRCWFSRNGVGYTFGEAENNDKRDFYFVVYCKTELGEDCFSLEQRFTEKECDSMSNEQFDGLLVAALCLYQDWCIEKQSLVEELEKWI